MRLFTSLPGYRALNETRVGRARCLLHLRARTFFRVEIPRQEFPLLPTKSKGGASSTPNTPKQVTTGQAKLVP